MKTLLYSLLLGGIFCCSTLSYAQSPAFPYNPDIDSNAYIELTDLLYFLDLYGQPWSFSNQSTLGDMMYYGIYQDEGGLNQMDWLSLPIGQEGQLLTVSNGLPEWKDAATILIETFPCLETLCIGGCTVIEACNYDENATYNDGTCDFLSCINFGCTDTIACNYDSLADYLDTSCIYANFPYNCDGDCVNDTDGDEICDELEIPGCTDSNACNYSSGATDDDGSCDLTSCGGCTDPSACNFDSTASIDDGSCEYTSCVGCTDESACNYVSTALYDDGSCLFPVGCDFCFNGAVTDGDTDGDGICNNEEIAGCQDVTACNYDSIYTDDADNCYYAADNGWCDCDGNVLDECGTCGGSGIPEGDCDCDGNVLDECGTCGGSGIPEGDCDCAGNVLDECGTCGGSGIPEGDCDCAGNVLDECGTCGGSGIPEGACDCDGNVLDECGVCNGDNACAPCIQVDGYNVGDIGPAGGIVIYDLGYYVYVDFENSSYDCWRYIEVSTEVLSPTIWGCNGSQIYGITNEIGSGDINTQLILNSGCDDVSPEFSDYAASSASSYNGGGQLDWFLPSPSELVLLSEIPDYTDQINGWQLGKYWSSNQFLNSTSLGTSIDFSVNENGELIATPGPSNVMNFMFPIIPMRRF
jgi:hypothetical protein